MKKYSIIMLVLLMLVASLLVGCNNTEEVPSSDEVCWHTIKNVCTNSWQRNPCTYCVETYSYCLECNERLETLSYEEKVNHKFADDKEKMCQCGNFERVTEEIGEPISEIERLNLELDKARKECNYAKMAEIINAIIALQDNNFQIITEIVFIGSVSNCTTFYDVNEETWTIAKIYENNFAHQFLYSDIEFGNVEKAIKKASSFSDEYLADCLVTIALNYETNGYEFYLEKIVT